MRKPGKPGIVVDFKGPVFRAFFCLEEAEFAPAGGRFEPSSDLVGPSDHCRIVTNYFLTVSIVVQIIAIDAYWAAFLIGVMEGYQQILVWPRGGF